MIRRRSRISRFPEAIRTQINEFLDANVEYERIIDWLNQQGYTGIEMYHISRWKDSGYQDWLHAHEHLEELEAKLKWADVCARQGAGNFHRAAMTLLVVKLYDAINRTDSTDINKLLESKPDKIPTIINSFAKFSRSVVELEKFRDAIEQRNKAERAARRPARTRLSPEAQQLVHQELNAALQVPEHSCDPLIGSLAPAGSEESSLLGSLGPADSAESSLLGNLAAAGSEENSLLGSLAPAGSDDSELQPPPQPTVPPCTG